LNVSTSDLLQGEKFAIKNHIFLLLH
jgi:hypothetical protein